MRRAIVSVLLVIGCGSAASVRPHNAATPTSANDIYLPPSEARGATLCFNADSIALRKAIQRGKPTLEEAVEPALAADDVEFLHSALKKQYAGYPELLQATNFDVDAFFADWAKRLRAQHRPVSFKDAFYEPNVELRRHIRDLHFSVRGFDIALERDPRLVVHEYQAAHSRTIELDPATCDVPYYFGQPMEALGVPVDYYLEDMAAPVDTLLPVLRRIATASKP